MIARSITPQIEEALTFFPVVGIIGPRQVGKTTLAKIIQQQIAKPTLFLDLERDTDLQKLSEPELYLQQHLDKCVIIDEVQNLPKLLPLLRWLVDQDRKPARFILTGSASPDIIRGSTETLAGRIAYFELTPFSLPEIISVKSQPEHWFRGGFPDALFASNDRMTELWLGNFIETFLQRDLRRMGFDITIPAMDRLLKMLASSHGTILNLEALSRSLGISTNTVKKYLDILEGSFLLRRLQPFHANLSKRLVRSPKIYLRDSGLLHRLLGVSTLDQLQGIVWLGTSWEGYVIEEIIRALGKSYEFTFFRTQTGAEVDLVIKTPQGKLALIEIKYSVNPVPSKGFYSAAEDLKPDFQYIILPEGEAWDRSQGVRVSGLSTFLKEELKNFAL